MLTSELLVSFLAVIVADDVYELLELLSVHPGLLNTKWNENPLFIAFSFGGLNVFKEIIRQKPELTREKDQRGYTVLHLASMTGDIAVAKALLDLASGIPQLCLLEDNASMIPLQAVVIEGHGEVIGALVLACPDSLRRLTHRHQTLFHLALHNHHFGVFQVLLQETMKFHQDHLFTILNAQDDEGNTVLHIATARKFVELRIPRHVAIQVNSINNRGVTPLDLHYQNISRDVAARKISRILQNAGAYEGRFLSSMETKRTFPECSKQILGRNNLQLVFYVMVVGLAINIPTSFNLKENSTSVVFKAKSLICGELPTCFYLLMFSTDGFMLGMGFIVVLLWSFCFRIATLLTAVVVFITYELMLVENEVLKFSVTFGHHCTLSAVSLVWLSGIAFVFFGAMVLAALNYILFLPCYYKSAEELKIKSVNQEEIKQHVFDEYNVNEVQRNYQPPRHWGTGSPSADI